jgi:hypothetical protein
MLSRAEWNFRDLRDDQVEECWTYEFTRECPSLINLVEQWRNGVRGEHNFDNFKRHAGGRKTGCIRVADQLHFIPIGSYFMFPEWPSTPYLDIPPGIRRDRTRALLEAETSMNLSKTPQSEAAEQIWRNRDASVPNLREIEPHPAELGMFHSGGFICMPSSVFDKSKLSQPSTDQISLFRLDWDRTDDEIHKQLANWLKANRPRPPLTSRSIGGRHPFRKLKKDLERLGKVRIVRSCNNDYSIDWEGKRLFADQPQWIKCRKSVEGIIAALLVVS